MEYIPCRLCLEMLMETNFVLLENFEKNMLETLIPVVNLSISCDTKICDKCTKMLQTSYDFKAMCLDNNERVKELLMFKITLQALKCKPCRLCGYGILEELDDDICVPNWREMVQICIPELDIYSLDNLSACGKCVEYLKDLYMFFNKCLKTEETIKRYSDSVAKNSEGKVKLCDILITENDSLTAINNGNMLQHEQAMESTILDNPTTNNDAQETESHDEIDNVSLSVQNNDCFVENSAEKGSSNGNSTLSGNCGTSALNNEDGTVEETQLGPTLMECSTNVEELLGSENSDVVKAAQLGPTLIQSSTGIAEAPKPQRENEINIRQGSLAAHLLQKFKCKLCSFATSNGFYLNTVHMLTHQDKSEVKMYKCNLCPYETKVKDYLRRHVSMHKNISETPMFKCNWCDFETKYKVNLRKHLVVHRCPSELTLFQCHLCGFTSKRKSGLRGHIYRHNNFRNGTYQCESCPFKAKDERSFQNHKFVHMNTLERKIFQCELCTYQAKCKADVISHMHTHLRAKSITS